MPVAQGNDRWTYIWGTSVFITSRAYKTIIGQRFVHPIFSWLWKSRCQMKHKVFFWLLLKDRLSTRDLSQRKRMTLESYTCDLCILQKRETVSHLFLRCNFVKACWQSIGVSVITTRSPQSIFRQIKDRLAVPFYMEIMILMAWSIWTVRNDWLFKGIDPTVQQCKRKFISEFSTLLHRARPTMVPNMTVWMQSL